MNRELMFQTLAPNKLWDIIIIGGGATGLGTAVDAASRGYQTLLIEQSDFAKGTTSRSTKLIHGGLRYLKQGNVKLVREALRERELLFKNAPHLAHPLPFVIPNYHFLEKSYYYVGLKLYDILAGSFQHAGSKSLNQEETVRALPTLRAEHLKGGILYYDGQFDDARLAVTLAQTFANLNGTILNYVKAIELLKTDKRLCGIIAEDVQTGLQFELKGKVVINATGAYCDALRKMDEEQAIPMIAPSRGVHLVLPKSFLPGTTALMIPKTQDDRVLFVIPWHDKVLMGTTDKSVEDLPLEPKASLDEISFILNHAGKFLTTAPSLSDVLSVFAGLRPLVKPKTQKRTAAIARDHTVEISTSGLITVAGGKWTTYRRMGQDVVEQAIKVGKLPSRKCVTQTLQLHGWTSFVDTGKVTSCYGSDANEVEKLVLENPQWDQPIDSLLPYNQAQVIWAVRKEMALNVEDVLARRTRALLLDAKASMRAAPKVAQLMATELQKDQLWIDNQIQTYNELAKGYLP